MTGIELDSCAVCALPLVSFASLPLGAKNARRSVFSGFSAGAILIKHHLHHQHWLPEVDQANVLLVYFQLFRALAANLYIVLS